MIDASLHFSYLINEPFHLGVMSGMFCLRWKHNYVFRRIISLISIPVVNHFSGCERSTKGLFCNNSVLVSPI